MKNLYGIRRAYILFIFSLLFTGPFTLQAQIECLYEGNSNGVDPNPAGVYSYSTDLSSLGDFEPIVFNIFYWGINDGNGDPGNFALEEEHCLTSVAHLNRVYNTFRIFFKYYGMDTINSDDYYDLDTKQEMEDAIGWAEEKEYIKTEALNVYVASGGAPGGVVRNLFENRMAIHHNFFTKDGTMVHEVGHMLGLEHTFEDWFAGHAVPQFCGDCGDEEFCTESVTRDPNDPNFNAKDAGDFVTDTPAIPNFIFEWCFEMGYNESQCRLLPEPHYFEYIDPETFIYTGQGTDCLLPAVPYNINPIDVKNYMTYAPAAPHLFFHNFTGGQYVRMLESIAYDPLGELAGAQTTIQVLYEPYKGAYSANGGFVGPQVAATFQPGFDYEFVGCGPYGDYPPPPDYNDTSFSYVLGGIANYGFPKDIGPANYNDIIHRNNYAIRILQLDYNGPRNCYSTSGPASEGVVIKFMDNVFNNNITVAPKDSTQINSPNLINDLSPGLYKIEKDHGGGAIEETVILKQNE